MRVLAGHARAATGRILIGHARRGGPSWDFTGGVLPAGVTFTRAGSATYFDAAGVLQTALADVPRFDHNPVTGALRGLLVEPSATNRLLNSGFTGAVVGTPGTAPTSWPFNSSGGSITVASGGEIGLSAAAARQIIGPTVALAAGETITISATILANPDANKQQQLFWPAFANGGGLVSTTFFSNGLAVSPAIHAPLSGETVSVVLVNGASLTNIAFRLGVGCIGAATGSAQFTRPQAEVGATPTSYIPTTTAAATRAADQPLITANLGTRDLRVTTEAGVQVLTAQALTGSYWPALTGPQWVKRIEVMA